MRILHFRGRSLEPRSRRQSWTLALTWRPSCRVSPGVKLDELRRWAGGLFVYTATLVKYLTPYSLAELRGKQIPTTRCRDAMGTTKFLLKLLCSRWWRREGVPCRNFKGQKCQHPQRRDQEEKGRSPQSRRRLRCRSVESRRLPTYRRPY